MTVEPTTRDVLPGSSSVIDLEELAYWYFRLNGFLTIKGFVVHPDQGTNQETDIDLIAVRFPNRVENLRNPMKDDEVLVDKGRRIRLLFVEVKTSICALNGPWTRPERKNMRRALAAIGPFPRDMWGEVAKALYEQGNFRDTTYHVSLTCLGSRESPDVRALYPEVPQVTWVHVCDFIYRRFRNYRQTKQSHGQWDKTGKILWDNAKSARSAVEFTEKLGVLLPGGAISRDGEPKKHESARG